MDSYAYCDCEPEGDDMAQILFLSSSALSF